MLEQITNQTMPADDLDLCISLSILAGSEVIYTYGALEGKNCRQIYIGLLVNEEFRLNRVQMTDESICELLKVISDRSKFEILRRISRASSYCQELAREMNLTTATISRHMSLLLDAGLVHARREKTAFITTWTGTPSQICATWSATYCSGRDRSYIPPGL